MIIFNVTYLVSEHAIERYPKRTKKELTEEEMKEDILHMVQEGIKIFEQEDHIYIRYQDYIFPCVKLKKDENSYKIKTILTLELAFNLLFYIEHLE